MMDALDLLVFEWKPARSRDIDMLPEDTYQFYLSMRAGMGQRKAPPPQAWGEIGGVPVE